MAIESFWKQSPAEAAAALGCGLAGLTGTEATARLAK